MWELVLSQVPIEWRVISMNIHAPLYVPSDPLWLPVNYGEAFRAYWVSYRMAMVVYRGWGLEVLLEPVPEGSAWFLYVFLWTVDVCAFKSIYNPTFLYFVFPVLRGCEKGFDGVSPFEMHLDTQAVAGPFEPFPQFVDVWIFLLFDQLLLLGWLPLVVCPLWMLCLWLNMLWWVWRTHGGKVQACRPLLMCFISLCSACCLVQTTLAQNA